MEQVTISLTVKIVMDVNKGTAIDDVISDIDYEFVDRTGEAVILDTEILDHNIIDRQ